MAEQATTGVPQFELRHRLSLALEVGRVSPAAMAEELDVSETTIRNYRSGRTAPSRATLRVWALRCGVPFEWLVTGVIDVTDPDDGGGIKQESSFACTRPAHTATVHQLPIRTLDCNPIAA